MKTTTILPKIAGVASLLLLLLALPAALQAEDYSYTTNDGAITITGYTGPGGDISIPDTIDGLPVTSITNFAFFSCPSLTNITIPNSVTNIGENAFYTCPNLTGVVIGSGVTHIGNYAFCRCYSLTAVALGQKVTSLGQGAFKNCSSLATITMPSAVTNIGHYAFESCIALQGLYFEGNVPMFGIDVLDDTTATTYYLPGTAGWSIPFSPSPPVLWNPQARTGDPTFGVRSNQFGFTVTGTTNIPIVIAATTNLTNPVWTDLQTCTLTNGSIYFTDPQWTNSPARFYRLRSP